jgi:hypothetical protein
MSDLHSVQQVISDIWNKYTKRKEKTVIEQLNEFISRGLIVVEESSPILVRQSDSSAVVLCNTVELKLKDQEYIHQLEEKVHRYERILGIIKDEIKKS